jgi:SHS2 domain-containing protein
MAPYKFLPDVALADIAFEVSAATPAGLFEDSAKALTDVMVDRKTLVPKIKREIELRSDTPDTLLYDFLTELIIIKDVESLLFRDYRVSLGPNQRSLKCRMKGALINRQKHALRNDVKAVTMHMFGIRRAAKKWVATIVLDI